MHTRFARKPLPSIPAPAGYNPLWLPRPAITSATVNGHSDVVALLCNVLNIEDRNYFSVSASNPYNVKIYTAVGGTLLQSLSTTVGGQLNWTIDYASCTHNIDAETRQAYVEITPQAGFSLTSVTFNTNHPAETNVNSPPNIVAVFAVLPALTTATSMFSACYALQSVTMSSLPALTDATNMFNACTSLQSVTLPSLPALTNATSMFNACYTLQSVTLPPLPALANTTNMFQNCYPLQSVTLPSLPALTNATSMFATCRALQSLTLPSLPALTTANSMFGTTTETTCLRSLRKLSTLGLSTSVTLRYTAVQTAEALSWIGSLGTSTSVITFDLRNNPFSTAGSTVSAPLLAKFPNATVILV